MLVALLLLAIATGLALVPRGQMALADLLFQSPATNTPDPNTPLATPTPTWTPIPPPSPTSEVPPVDTPTAPPADTPVVPPTNTPVVLPTNTPLAPIVAPTLPVLPPEPTAIPPLPAPEPILPPPAPPPTSGQPITLAVELVIVEPAAPAAPEAAEDQAVTRSLDAALFIDNVVIAFGYVWMCLGGLATIGAVLGGVYLWRRRARPPDQPVPDPVAPAAASSAAATPPQTPPPQAPAASARTAARHPSSPSQDLD